MSDIKKKTFKNKNLFDYLGNILCGKDIETYFKHIAEEGFDIDFKKVVLIKYLSMSPDPNVRQIVLDNQLTFDRMDCKTLYRYLLRVVPKQRSAFIKYIK
jgi:hypothetical protein